MYARQHTVHCIAAVPTHARIDVQPIDVMPPAPIYRMGKKVAHTRLPSVGFRS